MREIKFRAWDKTNKKMIYQEPVLAFHRFMTWHGGHVYEDGKLMPYVMLQYTGLKDKHGKEIYEGDIISSNDDWRGIVVWNEKRARFALSDGLGNLYTYMFNEPQIELEIIGNIYENKDLIN